ncbi:hypothetical protein BDV3_003181 [Batrachochytrium dendrobatidis]
MSRSQSNDIKLDEFDTGKTKGSRACDGCRVRKRKCDGLQPYCTNCLKSITRDEDGNPICTYKIEAKKRGPRPGYKDRMLQRLERLESILNPLVDSPLTQGSPKLVSDSVVVDVVEQTNLNPPAIKSRKKPIQQRVLDLYEVMDTTNLLTTDSSPSEESIRLQNMHSIDISSGQSTLPSPKTGLNTGLVSLQSFPVTDSALMNQSRIPTSFLTLPLQSVVLSHSTTPADSTPNTLLNAKVSTCSIPTTASSTFNKIGYDSGVMNELEDILGFGGLRPPQKNQQKSIILLGEGNDSMLQPAALQWATNDSTLGLNHQAMMQLQVPPGVIELDNFYLNNSNLYSSLAYPSILDPFPCVFNGTFGPELPFNNFPFLDTSVQQQNSILELETHLLMLGLHYNLVVPLSKSQSAIITLPQSSMVRLPNTLRDSLIATGVFYSSHPELFTTLLGPQQKITLDPQNKSEIRIRIARMYIIRSRKALNAAISPAGSTHLDGVDPTKNPTSEDGTPVEPLDDCDAVRTMLILATISFGLGDGGDSMQLVADAYRLAQKAKIYEASLLHNESVKRKHPLTVDSLVISVPRMVTTKPTIQKLLPADKFDRRVLWGSCLILDTYCAMASGYQSGIDEGDYPGLVAAFGYADLLPYLKVPDNTRQTFSQLGKLAENTIWEGTPLAVMFDDVTEMSRTSMLINSVTGEFESLIHLTFIMRRIMRYVRSHMTCPAVEFCHPSTNPISKPMETPSVSSKLDTGDIAALHNSLLEWYNEFPDRFRAFPSLESFARGVHPSVLDHYHDWTYNIYIVECLMTFLSAFSYLHLPLLTGPDSHVKLYRLSLSTPPKTTSTTLYSDTNESKAQQLWSSQQVLLACFRALTYMIRRLYTPTTPSQSPFCNRNYDTERLRFCQQQMIPEDTPSPALCWTIHSLNIYIISSAGLMAARSCVNGTDTPSTHLESIIRLMNALVLPSLERISKVWPMAQLYQFKLGTLLKGGAAEDWAEEAISYIQL